VYKAYTLKRLNMATTAPGEKFVAEKDVSRSPETHDIEHGHSEQKALARNLQGRHMQMIAIGTDAVIPCVKPC